MAAGRRPFVGGNWKMNTDAAGGRELASAVAAGLAAGVDVAVFPPLCYLREVGDALKSAKGGSGVMLGAQNFWPEPSGAFTGEVSAAMLAECGCKAVLTGHSERRHVIGESDELIGRKTAAAVEAGLHCVLCVGETLDEREAGKTDAVNERQLRAGLAGVPAARAGSVTVAYEPVWAIGTGRTASPDDAQKAHEACRAVIADVLGKPAAEAMRIQYGGSVKPGNAAELFGMPDIDGGLIGGASLKASDFLSIVAAAV